MADIKDIVKELGDLYGANYLPYEWRQWYLNQKQSNP